MGQGDSVRDFDPSESMENAGILCVFPHFSYCTIGAKDPPKPAAPIVRCCLNIPCFQEKIQIFHCVLFHMGHGIQEVSGYHDSAILELYLNYPF